MTTIIITFLLFLATFLLFREFKARRDALVWWGWAKYNQQFLDLLPEELRDVYRNNSSLQNEEWHQWDTLSIILLFIAGGFGFVLYDLVFDRANVFGAMIFIASLVVVALAQYWFFEERLEHHRRMVIERCKGILGGDYV